MSRQDDCDDPIGAERNVSRPADWSTARNAAQRVELGLSLLDLTVPAWESALDYTRIMATPGSYTAAHHLFPTHTEHALRSVLGLSDDEFAAYGFLAQAEFGTPRYLDEIRFLALEWYWALAKRYEERDRSWLDNV